ncbi:uncharacterized protein LOC6050679 [Culex quinquefasciatus]|uniref:uncharacterized protein LOC6050679 n=1 Tax=Culex quinquefasciatus TaxID=7176 RepID=UPI0018E3DA8A|nr:uncharacterized protein LOC6050679 [Culex quinquefasciatus]
MPASRYECNIELYTTRIFSNGYKDLPEIGIVPVSAPNYFPDKSRNLEQRAVRFSPVLYPPFSFYGNSTKEKANAWYTSSDASEVTPMVVDGQESLFLVEFCHKYNCSIKVVYDNDSWGEVFEDQTGTGSLGAVAMHKADIAVGAIYYWLGPYKFSTFTVPLSRSGLTVVVPKPIILAPWKTPFLSFPLLLWIAVAVSFVVGVFFTWFVEKARIKILGNSSQNPVSVSDAALLLIGLFIEQGVDTRRRDLASSTVLFVSMLFAGFMIGNMYNAGLAAVMTIPQYGISIDTTYDLATSGLPWGGTAIAWIFAIWKATEEYLKVIVNNYQVVEQETLVKNAKSGNFGFVGERTEFGHFVPVDYLDEESSQMLRLLKDDLSWETCVALVSKTCPFKPRLDELIMNIRQSGVQFYWELMASSKYLNMTHEKNILNGRQTNTEEEATRLTVLHFVGAFLILGTGFVGGSIVFVLETIYIKVRA